MRDFVDIEVTKVVDGIRVSLGGDIWYLNTSDAQFLSSALKDQLGEEEYEGISSKSEGNRVS